MKRPITNLVIGLLALFATHLAAQPTFTITPQTVTANVGDQFTVNIVASDFDNILSFQYSINWNSAAIQWQSPVGSVNPSALPGMTSASFGTTQSGNGMIGVSWSDPNASGVTVPDGTILFSLTFTVLTSAGTNISFTGTPVPFEVVNGNGVEITSSTDFEGAQVNGGGSGGGGGGNNPPVTGFAVIASDETTAPGTQICVDVTVNDFDNILSMQYTMEFNESKWSFGNIPVSSFGLPGLSAASFGTTQTGQGYISFSWSDPNATGVTVPDGTVIYQVCLNAIGSNNCGATTPFQFNSATTPIEVYNGSSQPVTFQSEPGDLEICDGGGGDPPGGTDLTFTAGEVESPNGSQICVDFTTDNFDCIVSAQYSIHFNQNIIQYVSTQNYGLPDMTAASFGTTNSANGTITFSWYDPTTTGVTVPDGTVMFQMCFNVIGTTGQTANITFNGTPTDIEVTGCVGNQTITPVFDPGSVTIGITCAGPLTITSSPPTNVSCNGGTNGGVAITVAGGSATKTYVWKNAAGTTVGTSQNLTGVGPGSYSVTVTSCGGSETASAGPFNITQPSPLHLDFTSSDIACFGETNGAIDITVTGGTVTGTGCNGYTYAWSNSATTQDLSGLAAGNYKVTVTDCNACTIVSNNYTIVAPLSLLAIGTPVVTNITCNGANNGTITINATGGGNMKEYRITPGNNTWVTTNVFIGLAAGAYNVQVRDEYGCVKTATATITQPDIIVVALAATNPTQGQNNGSITTTVTGGVAPYTYSWTGPNGPIPGNPPNPTGLAAGTYCVTVTDANSCSKTKCGPVYAPMSEDASNPSTKKDACAGQCNGSICVHAVGGVPPYQYAWSLASIGNNSCPTGLCAGTYTVTVTSPSIGQTFVQTFTIAQPSQGVSSLAPNLQLPTNSSACNGSITLNPTGGAGAPYSYVWSTTPAQTSNPAFSLCEGSYNATITDANGCTGTAGPFTLDFVPPVLESPTVLSSNACDNQSNGKIELTIFGGIPPYKFQISSPLQSFTTVQNTYTFQNLPAGTYNYTITDSGVGTDLQSKTGTVTVNETVLTLSTQEVTHATSTTLGHINIEVAGGSQNYTYQWNNAYTGEDPFNVQPGCYDVTVIDNVSGCIQVFDNIGVGLLSANFSDVQPNCPQELGAITVTPSLSPNCAVANQQYTYKWSAANGNTVSTMQTASNILPGTYSVTITYGAGTNTEVTLIQTYVLEAQSSLSVTAEITSDYNGFDIRCFGGNEGKAKAFPANGVTPYSYSWSNGANTQDVTGLSAGVNYTVTITDGQGCQMSATLNLSGPSLLTSNADASASGCTSSDSGQATVNVSGGVSPYDYHWSNGDTDKTADKLTPGENFSVTVTDFNGCTMIENVAVPEVVALEAQGFSVSDSGGPSGVAGVVVDGGTYPYTYFWPEYEIVTDSVLTELFPGTYVVRVTDANGCQVIETIKVDDSTECGEVRTVITPEGDGRNEEFVIKCLSRFSDNTLEIFNRWGQLVYHTDDYNDDDLWRGTDVGGNDLPDGVYFYVFNYFDPGVNAFVTKKGSVTVLRK